MCVAATAVLLCSNIVISALRKIIPDKVRIPCYIVLIAGFVTMVQMLVKAFAPALDQSLGIYLPLITTNCAVLGAALVSIQEGYSFIAAVAYGFSAALGFTLAIVIFAGVRVRLQFADPPRAFRGFPLTLVAAGLLAMAFSGFSGFNFG
jgi:electron transport complex protein RnfA